MKIEEIKMIMKIETKEENGSKNEKRIHFIQKI